MLNETERDRLQSHILGMFQTILLPEVTPRGCILARDADGQVYEDPVATHHLVEFCLEVDASLMRHWISAACGWFNQNNRGLNDPFFITTLAEAGVVSKEDARLIVDQMILSRQRSSGFIDIYAGYLDGGSIFSTLWAIKILRLLGRGRPARVALQRAVTAIDEHWDDIHRSSFKGFFCEELWRLNEPFTRGGKTWSAVGEILAAQAANGLWDGHPTYTAYIAGNLSRVPGVRVERRVAIAIARALRHLFDLDREPTQAPSAVAAARAEMGESAYLQVVLRLMISGLRYLKRFHRIDLAPALASTLVGTFPSVYRAALATDADLKRMKEQYGEIERNFKHLDEAARIVLSHNPYDRNVFVMMPFWQKDDERFERIERAIRNALKRRGYRAWLASDLTLRPQLWDNVATFLLSCQFGIAVFTRVEREDKISIREFNPNVSLELGFMLSRGKRVLILKDTLLPKLPTDLVGHLYREFNLNRFAGDLPRIVGAWIDEVEGTKATPVPSPPEQTA